MDDEMAQEALSKMKQAFAENGKIFGVQKSPFEAVEQWIRKTESQLNRRWRHSKKRQIRSKRKQCKRRKGGNMKWWSSKKNGNKSWLRRKGNYARMSARNENKRRWWTTSGSDQRLWRMMREEEMQRKSMKEMRIKFGRYFGRRCESLYPEDQRYCRWVQVVETESLEFIGFQELSESTQWTRWRRMPRGQEDWSGRRERGRI